MPPVPTPHAHDLSRYQGLLCAAARAHLDAGLEARGGHPHESKAGDSISMADAAVAARVLIGQAADQEALGHGREAFARAIAVADGFGHTRDVYRALVGHVFRLSGPASEANLPREHAAAYADDEPISHTLWHHLWPGAPRNLRANDLALLVPGAAASAPLRPFKDHHGTLDGWWYHELVGLHALANLIWLVDHQTSSTLWQRLIQTVDYHLEHTDPDNVSSQPWALAAFFARPQTIGFAERQLHDAEIALAQSDGRSGLVSGLLLADAAHTLAHLHRVSPSPETAGCRSVGWGK